MQPPYVFATTHELLGFLWKATIHQGVLGSLQKTLTEFVMAKQKV